MIYGTIEVGTEPVQVPLGAADVPVILNTGESTIYFGNDDEVSTETGIKLGAGIGYEFPNTLEYGRWKELWVVSDAEGGELRYATVG